MTGDWAEVVLSVWLSAYLIVLVVLSVTCLLRIIKTCVKALHSPSPSLLLLFNKQTISLCDIILMYFHAYGRILILHVLKSICYVCVDMTDMTHDSSNSSGQ